MDDFNDFDDFEEEDSCWYCLGDGYYHDCGDDTCCCLEPDFCCQIPCPECNPEGEIEDDIEEKGGERD